MPTLKVISATDAQYSTALLKSLNEQRSAGLFCDITIIIEDRKFKAHKTVLSAASAYFHRLFSVTGQVVELNLVRPEIFEHVLNYMYSSKVERVRSDMLEELIQAAQVLEVKFIANLASHVKGLPSLLSDAEGKNNIEPLPIITESFSVTAEESSRGRGDEEDDCVFVSCTDAQTRAAQKSAGEVIDVDKQEPVRAESEAKTQTDKDEKDKTPTPTTIEAAKPPPPESLNSPATVSSSTPAPSPVRVSSVSLPGASGLSPGTPSSSHSLESGERLGVHKKQVSSSPEEGNFKIRLSDMSSQCAPSAGAPTATLTFDRAAEIHSISSNCKVYTNIEENTYDVVTVKEDPGEGGSRGSGGKRPIATPPKPQDSSPSSPKSAPAKKKGKRDLDDHYELIMDGKTFYVCTVCKRPYVCLTSLRRHFNTHSWEKKYPCRHCNKVFALAEYRTKHEIQHTGEKRYQCCLCGETFITYQFLSTHCKQIHNQDPSGKKEKEDGESHLYRLLPCRTVSLKPYSWVPGEPGFISQDGVMHHPGPASEGLHSPSPGGRMMTWDGIYTKPPGHMPHDGHSDHTLSSPSPGCTEFEYITPETY